MLASAMGRLVRGILDDFNTLLPIGQRSWGAAILAEFDAIPTPRARLWFGVGGLWAVVRIVAREFAQGRVAGVTWLLLGASVGLVGGVIDVMSASRWPLWLVLGGGAFSLGVCRPWGAWRWGVSVSLALPLLVYVIGVTGPYAYDPGDVWYPFWPCIALALLGGVIGRRVPGAMGRR